ncbi:hypothetical protein SAY86_026484 [Trapa natans]|uniref:Protein POLLEN DEFECTIVE IN GUIDANCE 1 n=1 Tax=Trapa natans TaxID=22666 RepID=A0AAN7QEX4_TRANT|nr:hypothetical protein SAY86_026484 [Trapa natans]
MGIRSERRKLSFDILSSSHFAEGGEEEEDSWVNDSISNSDLIPVHDPDSPGRKRKNRRRKKKKPGTCSIIPESPQSDHQGVEFYANGNGHVNGIMEFDSRSYVSGAIQTVVLEAPVVECQNNNLYGFGELRQRSVANNGAEEPAVVSTGAAQNRQDEKDVGFEVMGKQHDSERPSGGTQGKLETAESLDWKQVMSEDPNSLFQVKSPVKYFMEEMRNGNSLQSTTTLGNEKERERVYDTIFRLPWRCELLIDVGVVVCIDSFLSLLTIMPARILTVIWKFLRTRQLKKLSAAELSDLGCLVVLVSGVMLLQQTDISLIYHMIRGQGTIKLYVVYNVLEIFDKLCQNFGGDVLKTLFNSAEGLANCLADDKSYWRRRFGLDLALAVASSIIHAFVLLAQAITLSTCIIAHNNALLALLVSNNFAEIKSNVFKRFSRDNVHSIVYHDSVERFHITAFMLFVLAQNIREAEDPWFWSFLFVSGCCQISCNVYTLYNISLPSFFSNFLNLVLQNAMLVYISEIIIDIIKHSFIAKFNEIKPIAYSEFLEDLCRQTLNIQTNTKNNLTFIPLAPACVVIRVLTTVYAAHLPFGPFPWRLFWMVVLFTMTYVMLASLKVMIHLGLMKHASWYVKRCEKRKLHSD